MADLIDREELLEKLDKQKAMFEDEAFWAERGVVGVCSDIVRKMPTIEPKRGEWVKSAISELDGKVWYKCSECGAMKIDLFGAHFCYHCGADMRGEDAKK